MSLLKRIEGATTSTSPAVSPPPTSSPPAAGGGGRSTTPLPTGRLLGATGQLRPLGSELSVMGRANGARDALSDLRARVQDSLIQEIGPNVDFSQMGEMRKRVQQMFDSILEQEGTQLTRADRTRLFEQIVADILGFGPIQPLLDDETVSEVMVNGPSRSTSSARASCRRPM